MNVSDFIGNTDKPPVSFCHQGSPGSLTQTLKGQFTTGETHVSITNPQSFHPAIQDTNNILLFLLVRGCTDVLCCILFILALLGYFAVGILGKIGPPLLQCEQFHYFDTYACYFRGILVLSVYYLFKKITLKKRLKLQKSSPVQDS